jgi:hypothetical protein
MRGEALHRAAVRGDVTGRIQRAEPAQQIARTGERRRGRRVEPPQSFRVRAPHREIERQRREIRDADFRRGVRGQSALGAFAPQPIADAGRGSARTARALRGGRARDARHFESVHAARRVEQAAPLESGVDHDAYAVDRETRLRDVRGEHDLAAARARGCDRRVLVAGRELSIQRQHIDARPDVAQHSLHAADLSRAGQEHEHVAFRLGKCALDHAQHRELGRRLARGALVRAGQWRQPRTGVFHLDRMHAPRRGDDRRLARRSRLSTA